MAHNRIDCGFGHGFDVWGGHHQFPHLQRGPHPGWDHQGPGGTQFPPSSNCGGHGHNDGGLDVDSSNNTIDTGRYLITASNDNSGTVTIKDKLTGETITEWGDPHISTSDGDKADAMKNAVTYNLPDGTKVTITPTTNANGGATTIDHVTVTKGNDAVTIGGFTNGHLQTSYIPHEGRNLDWSTADGIELYAKNGNIADLVGANGQEIKGNAGNIDSWADATSNSGSGLMSVAEIWNQLTQGMGFGTGGAQNISDIFNQLAHLEGVGFPSGINININGNVNIG